MHWVFRLGVLLPAVCPALQGVSAAPVPTSIAPNGLGTNVQFANGKYDITGGVQAGGNLFHSFSTFNLGTGDTADFDVSASVTDILARVTGGPSSIDGTITSTIGPGGPISHANLYFINPAGVIFTANAQLNLGGSFIVTTANTVTLSDGSVFHGDVVNPTYDAGLTAAPVEAFGFGPGVTPAGVTFTGAQLAVAPGAGIHVVAGNIALDGATLSAPSGSLTLFSAGGSGGVPFALAAPGPGFVGATTTTFGSISMLNGSKASINGSGGGGVVIRGGHLVMSNSTISSVNQNAAGGSITVQANGVTLSNAAQISCSTEGSGQAGNVSVQAQSLTLDGTGAPPPANSVAEAGVTGICDNAVAGVGDAGAMDITVAGALSIKNGAEIDGSTFSAGNGSELTVHAGSIDLDGSGDTAIATSIGGGTGQGSTGNAGNVSVTAAGLLSIESGGEIFGGTSSSGSGASVNVHAGLITIDDSKGSTYQTGIAVQANPGSTGNGGSLQVTVDNALTLANGGVISGDTLGLGQAASVSVQALQLSINNAEIESNTSGTSGAGGPGGDGGDVNVSVTGAINLSNSGEILADTHSYGRAGAITVQAGSLTIDGSMESSLTGIDSDTYGPRVQGYFTGGQGGDAGSVNVTVAGAMKILNGGTVSSNSYSNGDANNVTVQAQDLTIDGSNSNYLTSISSTSLGAQGPYGPLGGAGGKAGSVTVNVSGLLQVLGSGAIDTDTYTLGAAGDVNVHAGTLVVDDSEDADPGTSGITSASDGAIGMTGYQTGGPGGNAGKVTLNVDGALTVSGDAAVNSDTYTLGNAGGVTVHAGSIRVDGTEDGYFTEISSDTDGPLDDQGDLIGGAGGNAGQVSITATGPLVVTSDGFISSSTYCAGRGGDVTVQAGSLVIDGTSNAYKTGIVANSYSEATGSAGDLNITVAGALVIENGGRISASTFNTGNGGNLTIQAGSYNINGASTPGYFTGIIAESIATGTSGSAGLIKLTGGPMALNGQVEISSSSAGTGTAGGVTIVSSGEVALGEESSIAASAMASNAGSVSITAPVLQIQGGSTILTSAANNGGVLDLNLGHLLYLLDSQLSSAAQVQGGNMNIRSPTIIMSESSLTSNGVTATSITQGGDFTLVSNLFLANQSFINNSEVVTQASFVPIVRGELLLPDDGKKRLQEACARSVAHEASSLVVVGRGGTESDPSELRPDFGLGTLAQVATVSAAQPARR